MKNVASKASYSLKRSETRRHLRQPVDIVLSYRTVDQFYCDIATNLSMGGVFIRTSMPLPVGITLRISFAIPQFGTRVEANGIVIHHGFPASTGMGIKFSEIDVRALKALEELIQHRSDEASAKRVKATQSPAATGPKPRPGKKAAGGKTKRPQKPKSKTVKKSLRRRAGKKAKRGRRK
jgi:hypothetical protein